MKTLLICGDSFTEYKTLYDWAWYKKIADELEAEIINLSIVGASNFNIWHQVVYGMEHYKADYMFVSLTRPNRIEQVYDQSIDHISYEDFRDNKLKSWILKEWVADGDYPADAVEKFSPKSLMYSKDYIIANDIITKVSQHPNHCIINNLFTEYLDSVENISLRDYSDVVSGPLAEPETGHMYKSMHEKFYNDHSHRILAKLNSHSTK